jgi:hypothetical protein
MAKVKRKKNKDSYSIKNQLSDADKSATEKNFLSRTFDFFNGKIVKWILLLLLPILTCVYYYDMTSWDYDVWWHMALGKYYLQNHTMRVDHAIFSWTQAASDWNYNTWLGSTIFYLAHSVAGNFGFWLVRSFVLIGLFSLFYAYVKAVKISFNAPIIVLTFLIGIQLNCIAMIFRPELFSLLLFGAYLFIYFYSKSFNKNIFWLFPLLMIFWVNLHGGFILGLFIISLIVVCESTDYFLLKKTPLSKNLLISLWIAVALSYLATLVNPYGWDYHRTILETMMNTTYSEYSKRVMHYISLWQFLPFKNFLAYNYKGFNTAWIMIIIMILLIFTCIYTYAKKRILDITIITLNLVFFIWGMNVLRVSIIFPLTAFFSFIYLLFRIGEEWHSRVRRMLAPLALVLFIVFSIQILITTIFYRNTFSWFGTGIDQTVPIEECAFIKKWKIPGPFFNDYLTGGYLIWALSPDYKVFIDSRFGPYWKQVLPDYYKLMNSQLTQEKLRSFNEQYPFKFMVINLTETEKIMNFLMAGQGDWRLLYFGNNAAILIHKSLIPQFGEISKTIDLSPYRYKNLQDPFLLYRLFIFYLNLEPQAAEVMLNIYKQNVSDLFPQKEQDLEEMRNNLKQAEAIRRQRAQMQANRQLPARQEK